MPAPDSVKRLVDRFDQNRKVFLSPDCNEEQLRAEFVPACSEKPVALNRW